MKKRGLLKRSAAAFLSATVSAVTLFSGIPGVNTGISASAETKADKIVKISTSDVSTFNDTDNDGLGEFQGFGTSLCWWANRVGYSTELSDLAAKLFFNPDEGLGLTIGRYNVGGGDGITDEETEDSDITKIPVNEKAVFYGPEDATHPFTGTNMEIGSDSNFASVKADKCDADFGITRGLKVGKMQTVGWINGLDKDPGQGGNLYFDVKADSTDYYTVKMLFVLSGSNNRGVSLKVESPAVSADDVNVSLDKNEAALDQDLETKEIVLDETAEAQDTTEVTESVDNESEINSDEVITENEDIVTEPEKASDDTANGEDTDLNNENAASDDEKTDEKVDEASDDENIPSETENVTEGSPEAVDAALEEETEEVTLDNKAVLDEGGESKIYQADAATVNSDVIAKGGETLFRVTFTGVELVKGINKFTIGGIDDDWTLDFVKMAVIKKGEEEVVPEGADDIDISDNQSGSLLHPSHITRSDSAVPGYCVDVTKIEADKDISYYEENFARVDAECGYAWNYDWDADKNQVNVLRAGIEAAGKDNYLAEAFSNSPPYFMTESGCSSGNTDAGKDNLRADSVNAFATYMADVIEHLENEGIHFQSVTPMNEPYTNYWGAYSNKQEGCHFDIGESQSRIIVALNKALKEKGITDIVFSASDETSIDTAISSYKALSDEAKDVVTRIDTHTYSGSKRAELRALAEESGENLWMSEVDGSNTEGTNAGEMAGGLWLSNYMAKDLKGLMPSAWIIWDIIDTHVSNEAEATSYPEAYNEFDTAKDIDSWQRSANLAGGKSLWGVAIADHNNQNIVLTKKYYAFGQYSRYIRPGYTLIGSTESTVAAIDPKNNKLVIVATNTKDTDETWKFDLSNLGAIGEKVTAIRTSGSLADGENWADVSASDDIVVDKNKKSVTATVKANSITTYIVEGAVYDNSAEEVQNVIDDTIYAVTGTKAVLPKTVRVATNHSSEVEKEVTWHAEDVDLSSAKSITGVLDDGTEFIANIKFVKPNMYIFADCNNNGTDNTSYNQIDSYADLINEVPDKKYEDGSWGRHDEYGAYNQSGDDAWAYGWYAKKGQDIKYILPLEQGSYNVEVGFKEWWGQSRPMSVYADDVKLGDTNSKNGNNNWNTPNYKITADADKNVTFKVTKKTSSDPDPVLSFIRIQKLLNLDDLKASMEKAAAFEESSVPSGTKEKVHDLRLEAMDLMLKAKTTQEEIDNMKSKLDEFVGEGATGFTEEEIAANDYILYIADVGSSNTSFVPSEYKMGLYQSVTDKEFGTDAVTGYKWGYPENDTNSYRVAKGTTQSSLADTCVYMSDSITFKKGVSGFNYSFELSERANDSYKVSLGFKVPSGWGSKKVDIVLEGETVAESLSIGDSSVTEKTYTVKVKDNMLNVFVHNPNASSRSDDPVLNYIIVRADAAYTVERLQELIDTQAAAMDGKTYSDETLSSYNEALDAANTLIKESSTDAAKIEEAYHNLEAAFDKLFEVHKEHYNDISGVEGRNMYDNNGIQIQAHGGQIQQFTIDGVTKYYWYGEDKTTDYRPVPGVHLYTSEDLYNWTDEGLVLKAIPVPDDQYGKDQEEGYKADLSIFEDDEYFKKLYSDYEGQEASDSMYENKLEEVYWNIANDRCVMERPKVLYNDKTGKYVMWWHCDGRTPESSADYGKAMVGIATADSPTGPFKFVEARKLISADDANLGWDTVKGSSRDMNLFKDDDGTAYVIYSSDGNADMYIAKLDDTYTGLAADTEGLKEGENYRLCYTTSREAPAMFKYNGLYYMITSACTGWDPNRAGYATATSPLSKWNWMGDPCTEDTKGTTYDTQSTCVFAVDAAAGQFIYMGDRWKSSDLSDSRYVWVPVEFLNGGKIALGKYSNWTLSELEGKGTFEIVTDIKKVFSSEENVKSSMPSEVTVKDTKGTENTYSVTWNYDKLNSFGTSEVTGTLENGRKFDQSVTIIPEKLIYFYDCGSVELKKVSDFFNDVKNLLGKQVRNEASDEAYSAETKAGYTGVIKTEDSDNYDVGVKDSGDGMYEYGFWAGGNKTIDYAFDLEAGEYTIITGYQEWWNTTRPTKITVTLDGEEIASHDFTLKSSDSQRTENVSVIVPKKGTVKVSVSKTGNPDPVMSYIAVICDSMEKAEEVVVPDAPTPTAPTVEESNTGKDNTELKTTDDNGYKTVKGSIKKIKKGKNKGKYQLVLEDGSIAKGFVSLNGKAYYFGKKGIAKKGFVKISGKTYYTNKKGKLATGFKKINGKTYSFTDAGKMRTGLKVINGNLYYFGKDGVMRTGKVEIGGKTYTFKKNGKLKSVK
ncbi:glycoside hydrolase [Butyrivibrio sp. NC2002]|uniref:glycoside hydrolase n=1 Tax=Butyrivibrio sp. NC2002 TaxID=1410610 RepID=UPI00056445B6|nr:glycoside hydrolase [Butyrivibrio sp. NC2002]